MVGYYILFKNSSVSICRKKFDSNEKNKKRIDVRCGVRTHAHIRVPELKSGALDRSANLTCCYIELFLCKNQ